MKSKHQAQVTGGMPRSSSSDAKAGGWVLSSAEKQQKTCTYHGLTTLICKTALFQSMVRAYLCCCFHWQTRKRCRWTCSQLIKPSSAAYLLQAGKVYLAFVQLTIEANVQINKTKNSTAKELVVNS